MDKVMRALVVLIGLVAAACSFPRPDDVVEDGPGSAGTTTVEMVSGNGQSTIVGSALAMPFVVLVKNSATGPIENATVDFVVVAGGGSVSVVSASTDAQGFARTLLTVGTVVGENRVEAQAAGAQGSPIEFVATALVAAATELVIVEGNNQSGISGAQLPTPIAVVVEDMHGNPVPNFAVEFVPTAGGGSVAASPVTSNEQGRAETTWTLGTTAGANSLEARGAGVAAVPFVATGELGIATQIEGTSGNNQSGTAGSPLTSPFVVTVRDANDNPIPGEAVQFVITSGGGQLSTTNASTDATGQASTVLTLGTTAGPNRVEARATGLAGSPIVFDATGLVGAASQIVMVSGNSQTATVATTIAPFVVEVRDANDNPVPSFSVAFAVTVGNGTIASPTITNAQGRASSTLTLGTTAGTNTVEARGSGASPVTFTATGTPGPAARIEMVSGNNQSAGFGAPLADPIVARITDTHGNGVAGRTVTLVSNSGGTFTPNLSSNAMGLVQPVWTLGINPGAHQVEMRATGLTGSPVVFSATALGFRASVDFPASGSCIEAVDINRDNRSDIVTGSFAITVLLNTTTVNATTPAFAAGTSFTAPSTGCEDITIADFNKDGSPDVALVGGNSVSVLLNKTTSGSQTVAFEPAVEFLANASPTHVRIEAADINTDNKIDLVVGNTAGAATILFNTTTDAATAPTFAQGATFVLGTGPGLALADINGDTRPDLVGSFANFGTSNSEGIVVRLNTTPSMSMSATFSTQARFIVGTTLSTGEVIARDLDADGTPDLALNAMGTVGVFLNITQPNDTIPSMSNVQTIPHGSATQGLDIGDLNGDTKPDLVAPRSSSTAGANLAKVILNVTPPNATIASLITAVDFAFSATSVEPIALADVNGDGKLDLVGLGSTTMSVRLAE